MHVAFDADILSLLLDPSIEAPVDPATEAPTERASERLERLVAQLEKERSRIVIPAPALAEFLVIAKEAGPDYLTAIDQQSVFSIEPFDARAAIEAAAKTREALAKGDKKSGATGRWQCVKTDRQIVAVLKATGVSRIYSNDRDMVNIAKESGIEVVHVWQLPLPPHDELELPFEQGSTDSGTTLPTEPPPPPAQSPDGAPTKDAEPGPARRAIHLGDPGPLPPDSSPTAPRRPRSKQ